MSATATARVTRPITTRRTAQASGSTGTQGRTEAGSVSRPQLRVISGASTATSSSLPFLTLIILVLAGALIASMLLNAKMADTAYRMKEKQVELNVAEDHVETLRTQVQERPRRPTPWLTVPRILVWCPPPRPASSTSTRASSPRAPRPTLPRPARPGGRRR